MKYQILGRSRRGAVALMSAVLILGMGASTANAAASPATVTGPVTGGTRGHAQTTIDGILDLSGAGYIEEEYFLEGTATPYTNDTTAPAWGSDGQWSAVPTTPTAPYKTRLIVRRPADPARFNGTVVVEWMNVTGQADGTPDFLQMNQELLRGGYAWVGVSAQRVGVEGGVPPILGLKNWDPARYGTLSHPGDSYSYDIFSQAGQALHGGPGVNPLGDLTSDVQRVIADGESQSAGRMVTYINAIHPLVDVYDGFLVHSRGAGGAPLSQAPLPAVNVPSVARIRTDLQQPVFTIENETDVAFGFFAARQPDTSMIRTWELAGTAHFDQYGLDFVATTGARDFPQPEFPPLVPACVLPANTAHARYIYNAALFHLDNWIELGLAPPTGTPITLNPNLTIARDVHGNALGGVRLPELDVPIATQSGVGNNSVTPPNFCVLFGVSAPFSDAKLNTLYPNHGKYVSKYNEALAAVVGRFILPYNAHEARVEAAHSDIGK
jgi:hypothetical protein